MRGGMRSQEDQLLAFGQGPAVMSPPMEEVEAFLIWASRRRVAPPCCRPCLRVSAQSPILAAPGCPRVPVLLRLRAWPSPDCLTFLPP